MQTRFTRFAVGTLFFCCASVFAATPSLTLTYPAGGEVFTAGTTQQVRLAPKTKVTPVTVELSTDGGNTFSTLGSIAVPKTGMPTLSFIVPSTPSGNCIIRVSGKSKTGSATGSSAPFSIFTASAAAGVAPGSITTTSISAGAVVTAGLADGSVINPKLAPLAVTSDKVSSGAASNNFVLTADGSGNANWLSPGQLLIPDGTITGAKLAAGSVDLTTNIVTGILPVVKGGTGQSTFTNGQLLIGNSTGNTLTKATLTGTANQVNVTNAAGSITLSTPQDIGTASSPTFNTVTANGFVGPLATTTLVLSGSAAPSLAAAGQGKLYFDSTANRMKLSENGGSYNNFVVGTHLSPLMPGADVVIASSAVGQAPLVLQTAAGQTAPGLKVQNVNGVSTFVVEARDTNTAISNTFAGSGAGIANTTGAANTFVGTGAGNVNTVGMGNTFVGAAAGLSNDNGIGNSFFGANAGQNSTAGNSNNFFGNGSGFLNTGNDNCFFGALSGKINTSGSSNSFFGNATGVQNTTGKNNSLFGQGAGNQNTGDSNTFIGQQAGLSNTGGSLNTFVGRNAGSGNSTGSSNVFIGANAGNAGFGLGTCVGAGAQISGGATNATAIGANATVSQSNAVVLGDNTCSVGIGTSTPAATLDIKGTASQAIPVLQVENSGGFVTFAVESRPTNIAMDNTFVGTLAGLMNTTGNQNSIFGANAGIGNMTGFGNSFFGYLAGASNRGNNNSFFGSSAGFNSFASCSDNTFIGSGAGSQTTADSNTFVGSTAGVNNSSGTLNTFVGQKSGSNSLTGSSNTFVGQNSGISTTTESNNTCIGWHADISPGLGITNSTAIGANATTSQSNSVSLGSPGTKTILNGPLNVPIGATGSAGTATLAGGTVTVSTTAVTASSVIIVTYNTFGGAQGILNVPNASITAGSSFVIHSTNGTDTSTVNWWIIN